ncbi:MAG: hypothetical protein ABH863_00010 [Candidatus Micrarchaeota archaeon]
MKEYRQATRWIKPSSVVRRTLKGKTSTGDFDVIPKRNMVIVREKIGRIENEGGVGISAYPQLRHFKNFLQGSRFVDPKLPTREYQRRLFYSRTGPAIARPEAIGTLRLSIPSEGVPQEYGYPKTGRPTLFLEYAQTHAVLANNPHINRELYKRYANWRYYALEQAIILARKMGRNLLIPEHHFYKPVGFESNEFSRELKDACRKNGAILVKNEHATIVETN